MKKIRVLVVDDSAFMRKNISDMINSDKPGLATKLHLPQEESDGNIYRKIEPTWSNN